MPQYGSKKRGRGNQTSETHGQVPGSHGQPSGSRGKSYASKPKGQASESRGQATQSQADQAVSQSTGRILGKWNVEDLSAPTTSSESSTSISKTNFQVLSSYNWLAQESENLKPAIVAPGVPAKWNPPKLPKNLPLDHGFFVITQNAYRLPHCPVEPLLQALFLTQPSLNLRDIHIICDRNILQTLFRFVCRSKKGGRPGGYFDIGVEMVQNTAIFTRLDGRITQVIKRPQGYGHAFEKGFTKPSEVVPGMGEHYRIIGYTFAGLNLIVRYITDAHNMTLTTANIPCLTRSSETTVPNLTSTVKAPLEKDVDPAEALLGQFSGLKLQGEGTQDNESSTTSHLTTAPSQLPPPTERLSIRHAGTLLPQEHMIELKTTSSDCTAQCWFANTRNVWIGRHTNGRFTAVTKQYIDDAAIAAWEQEQKECLGKLGELLGNIVRLGKEHQGRMRVRCVKGTLMLEEWKAEETPQYSVKPLPSDLRNKW